MEKGESVISIVTTLMLAVALGADAQPVKPQNWQNAATWQKIKTGQSPVQVRNILGEPTATESTNSIEAWYYGETPKTDESGKTVRPKYGCLMFQRTQAEQVLKKWAEPNWKMLSTWEQLQADYKQAIADHRAAQIAERKRIADEAAAERAKLAEERKRIAEEAIALRQQQNQEAIAIRQERMQATGHRPVPAAKPDAHAQLMSKYFITIGGAFIVMAFIIAGTYGYKQFNS